jgi:hypothetical protein
MRLGDFKRMKSTWEMMRRLPMAFMTVAAVLASAMLGELAPTIVAQSFSLQPKHVDPTNWPVWGRLIGLSLGAYCAYWGFTRLARTQRWRPSLWATLGMMSAAFLYTLVVIAAGTVAGKCLLSIATDNGWNPLVVAALVGLTLFVSVVQAVSRFKGVYQAAVFEPIDQTQSGEALPAQLRPDELIIAMSRADIADAARALPNGAFAKALAAMQHWQTDDPLDEFLEAAKAEGGNHRWYHAARSLQRHFGKRQAGEKPAKLVVLVSQEASQDSQWDPERDPDWSGVGTALGFRDLLNALMQARFGDAGELEILSGRPIDIFDYSAVERAVRELVERDRRRDWKGLFRRRQIYVDVTAGPKPYSFAAGAATMDSGALLSYVDTNPPHNLWVRQVAPLR